MTLVEVNNQVRRITQRRIDAGTMSITLLSHLTYQSKPQLSNWLHGRRQCSIESLTTILQALRLGLEIVPLLPRPGL